MKIVIVNLERSRLYNIFVNGRARALNVSKEYVLKFLRNKYRVARRRRSGRRKK